MFVYSYRKDMLRQHLQQKLQQKLSPQQIQLIRLLELSSLEIEERIKQELEENPALEEGSELESNNDEETFSEDDGTNENIDLGDYMTEDDIPDYKLKEINSRAEQKNDIPFASGTSLQDHLLTQLGLRELTAQEQKIGEYIIGSLDEDGYLRRDLSAIIDDLAFQTGEEVSRKSVENVLKTIQDLEPAGIAAENLQECLLFQLERKHDSTDKEFAIQIIRDYFDAFVRKHYDKIMKSLNISETELKKVIDEITSLNPKPGGSWVSASEIMMNQVTPDFIVESNNGELILSMNQKDIPDLHINEEYSHMLNDYQSNKSNQTNEMKNAVQFVKQKLDSAQWFIDAVKQRKQTLQRTMEAIILLQKQFFLTGDESKLRPMILKDVAERTGYDISTISRVSNSKYVQTNFGVYPLKFFFSEATQNEQGEEISTREVKKIMRDTIDQEDRRKPITDEVLTEMLKEKGYLVARRTVAKYREQMNIPVARLRKEL